MNYSILLSNENFQWDKNYGLMERDQLRRSLKGERKRKPFSVILENSLYDFSTTGSIIVFFLWAA